MTGDRKGSDLSLKQPPPLNILLTRKQISALEKPSRENSGCFKKRRSPPVLGVFLNSAPLLPSCHFLFDRSRAAAISTAVNVSNQDCLLSLSSLSKKRTSQQIQHRWIKAWHAEAPVLSACVSHLWIHLEYLHLICCWGWGGVEHDNNSKRGSSGVCMFLTVCVRVIIQPE